MIISTISLVKKLNNQNLFSYLLVFISRTKLIINQLISNLLIPYVQFYLNKIDKSNKVNNLWFIYSSKYQYDLISCFLKTKYEINLYDKYKYNKKSSNLISIEILGKSNKNVFRFEVINFQELKSKFLKKKLILPHKIYLGSVSPFLFNDLLTYTFFRVLRNNRILKFIDDGISGNIDNNRNYNLNFCPRKQNILTWNFKNYFKDEYKGKNKISFYKLSNIIKSESLKESNLVSSKEYKLIISSKYLDYDILKNQILKNNRISKESYLYIPHNKKWKNSDYLLKNCRLINTKNIEAWIQKNSKYITDIYIGVSATSLIIGELKLLKRINSNINLCLTNTINPNNSRKEISSFLKSAIKSECYSNIYLDGKILKQI